MARFLLDYAAANGACDNASQCRAAAYLNDRSCSLIGWIGFQPFGLGWGEVPGVRADSATPQLDDFLMRFYLQCAGTYGVGIADAPFAWPVAECRDGRCAGRIEVDSRSCLFVPEGGDVPDAGPDAEPDVDVTASDAGDACEGDACGACGSWGGSCSASGECCAGLSCVRGICCAGSAPGDPCANFTDCCLYGAAGIAQRCPLASCCIAAGWACASDTECCPGASCASGVCSGACGAVGSACSGTADCCLGMDCGLGRCCVVADGCSVDADCCGSETGSRCVGAVCCAPAGDPCGSGAACCSGNCDATGRRCN